MAVVLVAAAAAGAAAVATQDDQGPVVPIRGVYSFDPFGDNGSEREDLVKRAVDGDAATAWKSEGYESPDLAGPGGKGGVGLVIQLASAGRLATLEVRTPVRGWNASIYVLDVPEVLGGDRPTELLEWGKPVAALKVTSAGAKTVGLGDVRGDEVLIWFTRLSDTGSVKVSEVLVRTDP